MPPTEEEKVAARLGAVATSDLMQSLVAGVRRFVIVDARNDLGSRLRAMASAMGVAAAEGRPLLVIWEPDAYCNASLRALFREPFPFALLEENMYRPPTVEGDALSPGKTLEPADAYQLINYLDEPGGEKSKFVEVDPARHLYFRSSFMMNHAHGWWGDEAQYMLWHVMNSLVPVEAVASKIITRRWMVGVHIRSVGPLEEDAATGRNASASHKEYGAQAVNLLRSYERVVPRMRILFQRRQTMFYVAADNEATYTAAMRAFPSHILRTMRSCPDPASCSDHDSDSQVTALIDMLNLARTGRILGLGYSSYLELASWIGANDRPQPGINSGPMRPVQMEVAGLHFGSDGEAKGRTADGNTSNEGNIQRENEISTLMSRRVPVLVPSERCPSWEDVMNTPGSHRWNLWQVPDDMGQSNETTPQSNETTPQRTAQAECRSGCILKGCDRGRVGPCCVRRMAAKALATCDEQPYGCTSPRLAQIDRRRRIKTHGHLQRWRKRLVVIDHHARPHIVSNSSTQCPSAADVWNTPADMRWSTWDDGPNCTENCFVKGCRPRRDYPPVVPCCVRRLSVAFPVHCNLLVHGCTVPHKSLYERSPPPPPRLKPPKPPPPPPSPPSPPPRFHLDFEPSLRCPSREDVMNTLPKHRWGVWHDEACADGCVLSHCNRGKTAPCCVKRMRTLYPNIRGKTCERFPHGCHNSSNVRTGRMVVDVKSQALLLRNWRIRTIRNIVRVLLVGTSLVVPMIQIVRAFWSPFGRPRQAITIFSKMQMSIDAGFVVIWLAVVWLALRSGDQMTVTHIRARVVTPLATDPVEVPLIIDPIEVPLITDPVEVLNLSFTPMANLTNVEVLNLSFTPMADLTTVEVLNLSFTPMANLTSVEAVLPGAEPFQLDLTLQRNVSKMTREGEIEDVSSGEGEGEIDQLLAVNMDGSPSQSILQIMQAPASEWSPPNWIPAMNVADIEEPSVSWRVEGEKEKVGAGLLFFAYGARKTLGHFLSETGKAARSFRMHNPKISIAVVTNNETVDRSIFDIHLWPRLDLLFAGGNVQDGQMRGDKIPRQWLTRLYYMAHSPFELTWALDSNVISCTPGAADLFLATAMRTRLWDYHIMHASQNIDESATMYPHNFNIAYMWSRTTSDLLRDWFLLTMRYGVASDDQKSLHMAELRQLYHTRHRHEWEQAQLRVGHFQAEFGAAFYDVARFEKHKVRRTTHARITQVVSGRVHLVHSPDQSLCGIFNTRPDGGEYLHDATSGQRQLLMLRTSRRHPANTTLTKPRTKVFNYHSVHTKEACVTALNGTYAACLVPSRDQPVAFKRGGDARFVSRALMEPYQVFVNSARCGNCV